MFGRNQLHFRELGLNLSRISFFSKFYGLKGYVSPQRTIIGQDSFLGGIASGRKNLL